MVDHFQVSMPEIQAAQTEFENRISELQAIADDIASIMGDVGGAPGGADCINGVQGMLDALKRLEADIEALPDGVYTDFPDFPDGGHGGDNGGNGHNGGHGHGGKDPDGKPGKHEDEEDDNGGEPHGGHGGGPHGNSGHAEGEEDPIIPLEDETDPQLEDPLNPDLDPLQGPELPDGTLPNEEDLLGAGVLGAGLGLGQENKKNKDEEEDEAELDAEAEYVSNANAPLKAELDEKQALLGNAQANLETMQSEFSQKQDQLGRLEAAFAANNDPKLAERINQLRVEVAELDANITQDQQTVETLGVEVQELAKRWSFVELPPGANIEKIQALEGGETSQWIKDATHNEDNSVNCVNYVVNRMPIPGELPLNAHLWDEQANKFATELGIKVGDVPLEGSILVMEREHSYGHDVFGHVMYVEKVENGIVWVTDNNYPDKMVRLDHLTDELTGPNIKYLYCPWQVVA